MFVIKEKTTNRKFCGKIHRQIWKTMPSESLSFFSNNMTDMHYEVSLFSSIEEAQQKLAEIKNNRIIKIPFEIDTETWESFNIIVPLLDESEINNPQLEIVKVDLTERNDSV